MCRVFQTALGRFAGRFEVEDLAVQIQTPNRATGTVALPFFDCIDTLEGGTPNKPK
jgi:hypothetical protein